jgi:DNA-binding beta-propeller fold protein YncE
VAVGALIAFASATGLSAQTPRELTGTVIVLNKSAATATFIDLATASIVATAPTGQGPHELIVSGDGTFAVGTDYGGGNSLSVFDVATGTRSAVHRLGGYTRPHGIAFLPGDSLVAVTAEAEGAVIVVRVSDGEIVQVLETEAAGSHMVGVTADGETMWTGDIGSNSVTELSRSRGRVRALSAPAQPEAVNVTRDGSRVFAGSNTTGRVTVFHTADGSSETIAEGFGWPYRMFLTPDDSQLIVPDLRGEVLRFFDLDSYEELGSIPFAGQGPQGLTLHPDGRHLFLALSAAGKVAIVDIERRQVVGELPAGSRPDGIGYSPITVNPR